MDDATVDNVAEMLLHDKIICVCQGKSCESKSISNRSILYLPNRKYAAHYFNERKVKHREWWLPYASVMILEEYRFAILTDKYYITYMLHTAKPTKLGEEAMSGVIHTDEQFVIRLYQMVRIEDC